MQETNFEYEVIVHDDASTDKTTEIICDYAKKYPNIIKPIIQTDNKWSKGVNIIIEYMLPKVNGKYIAFCEGDDCWIDPEKLQIQVDFLDANKNYSSCVHNSYFHHCQMNIKDFLMFSRNEDTDLTFEDVIKWDNLGYQYASVVYRKELVDVMPPFGFGEYPFAVYLVVRGKMRFLSRAMAVYRFRSTSSSTRFNVFSRDKILKEYNDTIKVLKIIEEYVSEEKKRIVQTKIRGLEHITREVENMTDEEYKHNQQNEERLSYIKMFIRSNFAKTYKFIKKIQRKYREKKYS